ncbi:OLC1v1024853C2 [Oldenlandia corymbosa var. corymbosa]|uniref:OLC1v1024853C2 n=1 Tax=Oldenlandia corymbosa var. corymbosa TaxID=529605 RepID=A0AAV1C6D8_OLDCO|nr:OLC1v1024853C2 [Oldenlandia corymbosa var. corymbosa]
MEMDGVDNDDSQPAMKDGIDKDDSLPLIVEIVEVKKPKRIVVSRPGFGTSGRAISLLTNSFKVAVKHPDQNFYQYSVSIKSEEGKTIENKRIRRKVIDKLYQTYSSELDGKKFAYDGEKTLYTVGHLPQNYFEFTLVLEEAVAKQGSPSSAGSPTETNKRTKLVLQSRKFEVGIAYAAKIPLKSISLSLEGAETADLSDALRVLDTVLRQQAADRGCLLVRQSFFHDDSRFFDDLGEGVTSCRGFHSSFRPTQGGLSLTMDVSTTMILTPGPVIDFLLANQNAKEARFIDWAKARKMLKNIRVRATHSKKEFKITGLSENPCDQQLFSMKLKNNGGDQDGVETTEITVYDYFTKIRNIKLLSSAYMPCINVGKPERPNYLPMELCSLVSLQRYKKALSSTQRETLIGNSRKKPPERIQVIMDAKRNYGYDDNPLLSACGVCIEKQFSEVNGRVLEAPKLKVGEGKEFLPCNGRWNFNNKLQMQGFNPTKIAHWAVVNFSSSCDTSYLSRELINCGRKMGIHIERPFSLIEEAPQNRRLSPITRVEKMFEQLMSKLPEPPEFLLCVLPERKNSELYGPWKKRNLSDLGIVTQCVSPIKITDQYLSNLLLKINAKLGGINSLLLIERPSRFPFLKDTPTMLLGMDVSHGSPGRSDAPSIAAVVGSRSWPLISRYGAAVRTQPSKVEMIESLFKPLANGEDDGIMRELLVDFYSSSDGRKPAQIIVFRDGVSESQFSQVLDVELDQMIKAYAHLGEVDLPKFTVIVAQKNHHTRFFQRNAPDNVPAGTVVDKDVVHPRNYDFYMFPQAGIKGTSRPVHYHVLLDEIGFSPDELQNLIHSLSYVYQRSTSAISVVAPIRYAHLAAKQMGQFVNFEDLSVTSSEQKSEITSVGSRPIPELPRLDERIAGSMFFC